MKIISFNRPKTLLGRLAAFFLWWAVTAPGGHAQVIFWEKNFGGKNFEEARHLTLRQDGTFIVAGETSSSEAFGQGNQGENDVFVFKYSTQGVTYWKTLIGGNGWDELGQIIPTQDGGYALIGTTESTQGSVHSQYGKLDIFVAKLNWKGEVEWTQAYGGSGNDRGFALAELTDGSLLIGGESGSHDGIMRTPHRGGLDGWVAHISTTGKIIWERHIGSSEPDKVVRIHPWANHELWVVASSTGKDTDVKKNIGKSDVWGIFLNELGQPTDRQFTVGGEDHEHIHDSYIDADSNLVLVGTTFSSKGVFPPQRGEGDAWLLKVSPQGEVLMSRTYGGSYGDGFNSISPTADGGWICGGLSQSKNGDKSTQLGYWDGWALKLDRQGNVQWDQSLGHLGRDWLGTVLEAPGGGYLAAGAITKDPKDTIRFEHHGQSDVQLYNFGDSLQRPYITPPLLSGTVRDLTTQNPLTSSITLINNTNLDTLGKAESLTQGDFQLLLPSYGFISLNVLAKGYLFYGEDIDMDTVNNKSAITKDVFLEPIRIGSTLILKRIYFNTGKWELLSESYSELALLTTFLNLNPRVQIQINGHTDNTGDKTEKMQLSLNRAETVRDYLKKKGIADYRMRVKGYGLSKPIASNDTPEGRQKNRRVEFVITNL